VPERDPEQPTDERPFDSVARPADLPPGWRVDVAEGDQVAVAERLEYDVFVEIGYCGPSPDGRAEEFDPWRDESRFKVVLDTGGGIHGVARELYGSYDSLPVGSFPRWDDYPPDPVFEYASLAVPHSARDAGIAEALYRSVWQDALRVGASGLVAIGAEWLLAILNDTYDLGFRQLGPGRHYMGSECIPVGTSMSDLLDRLKNQPRFFRWATEEIDLRDLPVSEFRSAVAASRRVADDDGPLR
jgi:hypothetical protein